MARTRVKICGVTEVASALVAAEAGADAVGRVFVGASPRCVSLDKARSIVAALPALVQPIALFMDAGADEIRHVAGALGLHTVQLHGRETPQFAADLAPLRIIKALAFDGRRSTETLNAWRSTCPNLAGILFDAPRVSRPVAQGTPQKVHTANDDPALTGDAHLTGGTGRKLDWQALGKLVHGGMLAGLPPHILAGGLDPDNVADAMRIVRPYAVDVSSGVEATRGVKDPDRIRAFVRAVVQADVQPRAPAS